MRPDVVNHLQDDSINPLCGFSTDLITLGLPDKTHLSINAITEQERTIPLVHINIQCSTTVTDFKPKLQPIIVTTLGRTGSTWLMQLLAKHPSIIVAGQHPYETFALEYWLHFVSQQLLSPHQGLSPVDQKRFDRDFLANQPLQTWFHEVYYKQVISFCQEAIDSYYNTLTREQSAPSTQFFAEKIPYFSGDGSTTWRQLSAATRELYPEMREIVLVRDFRDMVLSALHFGAKDKSSDEIEQQKSTACDNVTKEVAEFSAYYRQNRANTYLVRYEDLLLNTKETLKDLLESLSLPCNDEILRSVSDNRQTATKLNKQHITSKSVEKSVARWKRELNPQQQKVYTSKFRYDLNLFGYDL
jgi:hypothetical protein